MNPKLLSESDSESYTGTPIKMPPLVDQGRLMQKSAGMGERKRRIISLKKSDDLHGKGLMSY